MLASTVPWLNVVAAVKSINDAKDDTRPFLAARFADHTVGCLVDTGANVSVMAADTFQAIYGPILPTDKTGRYSVTSVTGAPIVVRDYVCLLYTSPSPRDKRQSRMPSSA